MATVVILHTNDLHGCLTPWRGWDGEFEGKTIGGLGRLAAAIADVRREFAGGTLLLDAGDLIGDTMLADLTKGKALIDAFNHLGYDAMTIGNHEPDFGTKVLRERVAQATFPVLAANVTDRKTGGPFLRPYVVKRVGGVDVGVLGLAYPKTERTTAPTNVAEIEFLDPAPAAARHLREVKSAGAEIVVVLSHLGLAADKRLARDVSGIDVIVGGHSHNRMAEPEEVAGALIVQAGAHGSDLGRLDLTVERGKVVAHRWTLTPLDNETLPGDAAAERLLESRLAPHRAALDEVVGRAAGRLVRAQTLAGQRATARNEESPVDSLFADILRSETRADASLLPGVGYGVAIPPGPVTAAQLRQLVPHDGKVVTMRLSGVEVVEVLEQAVENTFSDDPAVKVGGMIQVAGLRFNYDPEMAKGHRVVRVERADGRWDPAREYLVATNSMLAAGGHNYRTLANGRGRTEYGSQFEIIRGWFGRNSPVSAPAPGRIIRSGVAKS